MLHSLVDDADVLIIPVSVVAKRRIFSLKTVQRFDYILYQIPEFSGIFDVTDNVRVARWVYFLAHPVHVVSCIM